MKALRPTTISFPSTGQFTRASTATYVENGVVKTAPINEPRWQNGVLLFEDSSTNLVTYSEEFNRSVWTKVRLSVTTNVIVSPDDTTTADKITEDNTLTIAHRIELTNGISFTSGNDYVFTIYAKAAERNWFYLDLHFQNTDSVFGLAPRAFFNLNTGEIGTTQNCIASISALSDGWYRCSVKSTATLTGTNSPGFGIANSDGGSVYSGDSTSGVYVWGAQLEAKPQATSYIQTLDTVVTRQPDTFTGTGLIYTNATDTRPLWSSATTYAVGAIVRYNNKVYESLQATNLNKQPDINPTWWLDLGADNISAAFDGKVGSKTTSTDVLRMIIRPDTNIDSVAYVEANASLVTTSVIDEQYNIVYTQNSGLDSSTIADWYDYFFIDPLGDPITQVVHQGINPIDPNLLIGVEIVRSGTVELGSFLTGQTTSLGLTQYGLRAGIVDYSKKESDEFGNISVVERAYSKRLEADIYVYNYDLNKVQRFLYNVRAVPVLWIATDDPELAEVSNVYGFYKDFSTTIAYPDVSLCSLQVEGLT